MLGSQFICIQICHLNFLASRTPRSLQCPPKKASLSTMLSCPCHLGFSFIACAAPWSAVIILFWLLFWRESIHVSYFCSFSPERKKLSRESPNAFCWAEAKGRLWAFTYFYPVGWQCFHSNICSSVNWWFRAWAWSHRPRCEPSQHCCNWFV